MKNLKLAALALFICLFTACGENVSINSISVEVLNKHKKVAVGEQLKVDISVRDDEGIDYLLIEIPVLAISQKIEDLSANNKWKLEKHFLVENTDKKGVFEIFFTVMDKGGEEYMEIEKFIIR